MASKTITADEIIALAKKQVGVKESPAGSNNVKYNTAYYGKAVKGSAYPWCCAFIWWLFMKLDASKLFYNGKKTAYCPAVVSWAKSKKIWKKNTEGKKGDLVLFNWRGGSTAEHIGIVIKKNSDGTYQTIEGNTSVSSNDNGGTVMIRTRNKSCILGFARPKYATKDKKETSKHTSTETSKPSTTSKSIPKLAASDPVLKKGSKGTQVKYLQQDLNYVMGTKLAADGDFGNGTYNTLVSFQKKYKLTADGIYGNGSKAEMKKHLK